MIYIATIGVLLLGLIAAQIVNYLSDVLPQTRGLSRPGCANCRLDAIWTDYILLQKCAGCNSRRSIRTWLVQIVLPLFFLFVWFSPPDRVSIPFSWILLAYFSLVTVIDIEHRLILRPTSLPGLLICGAIGFTIHGLTATLLGGIAGMGIMLVLYYLGKGFILLLNKYRGTQTDEVALGFGDVTLSTILGLLLGWPGIVAGLTFAILLAGIFSAGFVLLMLLKRKYSPLAAFPYGPFLILGSIILLLR